MCEPTAIVTGIIGGLGFMQAQQSSRFQFNQAQSGMDMSLRQYYRDLDFQAMQRDFQSTQFQVDMSSKMQQVALANAEFMSNARFRQQQLAQEMLQREGQLNAENLDAKSKLDYARRTMESAYDTAGTDIDLLNAQYDQFATKTNLDMFERRRQAMKEAATIRVSQGESGIFGNTALKELANTVMQSSYDQSIMEYNLKNFGDQKEAEIKKVKSTAISRTNEALSGVVNRYVTGTASQTMNPALTGLAI